MAIKHSRQGIALGAVAALGVAMLGAAPAYASGDADFVDLHLVAGGNGVTNGLIGDGMHFTLEWEGDVDTSTFDKLTWRVLSAVDQNGEDIEYDMAYAMADYNENEDYVDFEDYWAEDIMGDWSYWAPFAGEGSDTDDSEDNDGYVGPYEFDATSAEWAFNNDTFKIDYDGEPRDEEYVYAPWLWVDGDELYTEDDVATKNTLRVQAFVDSNLNNVADANEVRSAVSTVTLYDRYYLTGTVSQADTPGWFFPEITPSIELDVKLNDWDPYEDWATSYNIDETSIYYLALQQVTTDGNDSGEYDFFDLMSNDIEDGYGWTVGADGTVTYEDTFSYINEGSKVNRLWIWNEDEYEASGLASAARVSNLASFGYVAASKIVKRSNTTAKMYAFDILNA
ncbi:MAG: hypothetical protein RL198_494, partial [Actinomycetota bacterium]